MAVETPAQAADLRQSYVYFVPIATRATDLDENGQLTAAACCVYFEAAIRAFLRSEGRTTGVLPGPTRPYPLEAFCRFHRSVTFPQNLTAGLRVTGLGFASVRYEIGLFRDDEAKPAASGHVVHVFVDSEKGKPGPIPPGIQSVLRKLVPSAATQGRRDPAQRCG